MLILYLYSIYYHLHLFVFISQFNLPATIDKKRSKLWSFFMQSKDDKAKCDLFYSLYLVKGGYTTNLKSINQPMKPSFHASCQMQQFWKLIYHELQQVQNL